MKILQPTVELLNQNANTKGLKTDLFAHIVKCAQICYKLDKPSDDPEKWIQDRLLSNTPQHTSPLEHGTVYLTITIGSPIGDPNYFKNFDIAMFYTHNKYSRVVKTCKDNYHTTYYITTNYRVVYENGRQSDLELMSPPFKKHIKRYTVKVGCDIGVSREANRHRVNSICEQSTRYCNYSLDRFSHELQISKPSWMEDEDAESINNGTYKIMDDGRTLNPFEYWYLANRFCEYCYMKMVEAGAQPQIARSILPLDTRTEVVYTAFEDDWDHFLSLRDHQNAHPDMQVVAKQIKAVIEQEKNKYL